MSESHKSLDAPRQPLTTQGYEAYDLYLRGRYFWNKRTPDGLRQAIECFRRAIDKDPSYARAYAGLADAYAMLSIWGPSVEAMPKARAAAVRALELDETLAEAHTSLAVIAENYDFDWYTAEKEYQRAIQLNPNYATAHHWYAECLAFQGRFDEALIESDRALRLDPLSLIIASDRGAIFYFSRQYDRAIEQFRAVQEMDPNFPRAHLVIPTYIEKGEFAKALAEIERWRGVDPTPWAWALEAYMYGRWGKQAKARRALETMEDLDRRRHIDPTAMALMAYIGTKNNEKALASLEKAYSQRSNVLAALKVDPVYDPLRSDLRFKDLLRRVGLGR